MEELDNQLDILIERLENSEDFKNDLEKLNSVYPFSKYEYIISALLANKKLTFDEYLDIRNEYLNRNLYLSVFEISAPRGFGDTWAFGHLLSTEPALQRPSKKLDIAYKGEYDLFLEWKNKKTDHFIKIEVKASRATDRTKPEEHLNVKALSSHSDSPFLMNFQQLKPKCCDVFLWIAVYRDLIKYWVISANAIHENKNFTPQHRNQATAERASDYSKADIYEGQIMMTNQNINDFADYLATERTIKSKIIEQYKIQKGL